MMSVYFKNNGAIDLDTIRVMGVSVKENENAIGYFGTGLKFALATLLRTEHKVVLYRQGMTILFEARPKEIRGETFNVVTMNGEELGFTTQLGRNWEIWQAYRELYCNCKDEDGVIITSREDLVEDTVFEVSGGQIDKIHSQRAAIVLESEPFNSADNVEIRRGGSKYGFYRGIRVHDLPSPSLFTWNVISQVDLTEDRTLKYPFEFTSPIQNAIVKLEDEDLLREILVAPEGSFEKDFNFNGCYAQPSEAFLRLCKQNRNNLRFNNSAIMYWMKKVDIAEYADQEELDEMESDELLEALKLCNSLGCSLTADEITFVPSLGEGGFGVCKNGKIYISKIVFDKGYRFLASTIYEEWCHRDHGVKDFTREFQDLLLDKLIAVQERLNKAMGR